MTMISPHFSYEEMTRTKHPYDNTPTPLASTWLRLLCFGILEVWRVEVGPIVPTSGYRSPLVNQAAGGEDDSQHLEGKAADVRTPKTALDEAWRALLRLMAAGRVRVDQAIIYVLPPGQGWIHVSTNVESRCRSELLVCTFVPIPGKPGKTKKVYTPYGLYNGPLVLPVEST